MLALGELRARVKEVREQQALKDAALVAVRVALAWLFIYHGASTLFGAFHGAGIDRTATFFAAYAHLRPGKFFALCNGITEFFGGMAIGVGLCARLAAVGLFVDMVIAMVTLTFKNGLVSQAPGSGYELNVALAGLAIVIVLLGSGRLSLDAGIRLLLARRFGLAPDRSVLAAVDVPQ